MNWTTQEIEWIDKFSHGTVSPSNVLKLRSHWGVDRASEILSLAALQTRARRKFGDGVWMVTEKAVEQASDRVVATYKASLVDATRVVDLCSGVGGDAIALGCRGHLIAVDADARLCQMLHWNLHQALASSAVIVCDDAMSYINRLREDWSKLVIHIDPDRRPITGERFSAPDKYSPALESIEPLWTKTAGCMAKLAPAAQLPATYASQVHRQWISLDGSVREQTLLSKSIAAAHRLGIGQRSAVRVHRDGAIDAYCPQRCEIADVPSVEAPQQYVFDVDPAVRAAGLSESFAAEHDWQLLGTASGFFTSSQCSGDRRLLQAFRTVWAGPADRKTIKRELARLGRHVETIKVRGSDHDPARFRRQIAVQASSSNLALTLLIGRAATGVYAVLADPI